MSLKLITLLLVLAIALVGCRFTDDLEAQPTATSPVRPTRILPYHTIVPPTPIPGVDATSGPLATPGSTGSVSQPGGEFQGIPTPTIDPNAPPTPTPDFTSRPAISEYIAGQMVLAEIAKCKTARDDQYQALSFITVITEYLGSDVWLVETFWQEWELPYGLWTVDANSSTKVSPYDQIARDVIADGAGCTLPEKIPPATPRPTPTAIPTPTTGPTPTPSPATWVGGLTNDDPIIAWAIELLELDNFADQPSLFEYIERLGAESGKADLYNRTNVVAWFEAMGIEEKYGIGPQEP